MIRARSCWTWRSRWPWAGTAWPTSRYCGPNRRCSDRWPPTRTVSRLADTLATSEKRALTAIRRARAQVREHVWALAGDAAPGQSGQVIVDLDGVLVIAHSDKQNATATWKRTFGHHPIMGFVDHGAGGAGEPVAGLLRAGNAGSNTAADHINAT